MINNINRIYPDRFRIRFSDDPNVRLQRTCLRYAKKELYTRDSGYEWRVVCPEQLGNTDSCATCG